MPRKKKDIPLIVLETLEPYLKKNDEIFEIVDPKESLLRIIDSDTDSDFYFEVVDFQMSNGKTILQLDYKPQNKTNTGAYKPRIVHTQLDGHFENWTTRLSEYAKVESIYDDPILKKNAEKFFQKFDIIDEDAEYTSFDLEQQLFLEEYLDNTKQKLEKLKKGKSEDLILELEELETEAEKIKAVITKESKKKIIRRLSIFWGKAQKTGIDVIKEIFISVTAELAKRLMIGA
jgi:hypothetical protein